MKRIYNKPMVNLITIDAERLMDAVSGVPEDGQGPDGGSAKRHNDFWSDMEETASSWPKGKSVWDD